MTHILVNPGYSLRLGRAKTVDGDLFAGQRGNQRRPTSKGDLGDIRSGSRMTWLAAWEDPGKPAVENVYDWHSTYSKQYDYKKLDQPTKSRPTSPTRRNNPHPPGVFLRWRVLKDKGHHPASKPGQNPYAGKYAYNKLPVPDGTMYYTLKDVKRLQKNGQTELVKKIMNPTLEHAGKTGFKIPSYGGKVFPSSPSEKDDDIPEMAVNHSKPEVVPSLHRFLRCAGKEEREKMSGLKRNLWIQESKFKTVDPNRYLLRTYTSSVPEVKIHRPYRREFTIHPELWTK